MPFHKDISHSPLAIRIAKGKWQKAFTLIETVVVLGILTFVTGSTLVLITNILKSNNQARINAEVKQAGQVVLDSLESQIRNAPDAEQLVPDNPAVASNIKLRKSSEEALLYIWCVKPDLVNKSNGWIGTTPDGSNYQPITSMDSVSGINISDCSFNVTTASSGSPALVFISFTASQGVAAPSRKDFEAKATFQTTISLRSYK